MNVSLAHSNAVDITIDPRESCETEQREDFKASALNSGGSPIPTDVNNRLINVKRRYSHLAGRMQQIKPTSLICTKGSDLSDTFE